MSSFRTRLTLWNLLTLALGLTATSAALVLVTRAWAANTVDAELLRRAERAQGGIGPQGFQRGGPRGPGFQQFEPSAPRNNPQFEENRLQQPPQDSVEPGPQRNGPGFGPGMPAGPNFSDIRVPRVFRPDGSPLQDQATYAPWDAALLARSQKGETVFKTIQASDRPLRIVSLQLPDRNVVQAATDMAVFESVSVAQVQTLAWILPLTLLLAGAGALFLTARATRPISQLTEAASKIDETTLDSRLPVSGSDEFAALTSRFNEMVGRLQTAVTGRDRTIEAQRRFAADASHELRTPLTRIKLVSSSALEQGASQGELEHALKVVDKAADDMDHLVGQLLTLARAAAVGGPAKTEPVPLQDLFQRAIEIAGLTGDARLSPTVEPHGLTVMADPGSLARAIANVLTNAARHTPESGTITLTGAAQGGSVAVTVQDTGEGIAPEHVPHLTERFYRVDTARSRALGGTGLGLAIVSDTVLSHNGTLEISSETGKGTLVTITLEAGPPS